MGKFEPRHYASDPATSVWVSANAGSGKTKVLTDRVLRLLLEGAHPSKILCLTYTNAAAAEMKNRIYSQLSKWVSLDDEALQSSLNDLTGTSTPAFMLSKARRLFASVIDSPDGVRIQTIHAFCQSLLRRFPVESKVSPHFTLIDENTSSELIAQAKERLFMRRGDSTVVLQDVLGRMARRLGEFSFSQLLEQIVKQRRTIQRVLQPPKSIEKICAKLEQLLLEPHGINEHSTISDILNTYYTPTEGEMEAFRKAAPILLAGRQDDKKTGEALAGWIHVAPQHRHMHFDEYVSEFKTSEHDFRKRFFNNDVIKNHPWIQELINAEVERLRICVEIINAHTEYHSTLDMLLLADAMLSEYGNLKFRHGYLDFEDLILKALQLLSMPDVSPWVLYKLDGGLDHLLIDEAQDTSPEQWRLLYILADEFFSGEGAARADRTVFVVGDEKQSIYSFQGADPREFGNMQSQFSKKILAAGKKYLRQPLIVSYRSTEAILQAVDAVFASESAMRGVTYLEKDVKHEAFRTGQAGLVECWEPISAPEDSEEISWETASQSRFKVKPETLLARRVASTIRDWLDSSRMLVAKGRPVEPRDIIILVRSRTLLVKPLLRALRRERIPVAGSDRLVLCEHIAVKDMLALMQFLLLPQDDLNLAIVLRSPLMGVSEELVFTLAHARGKQSLWERVRQVPEAATYHAWLAALLAKADFIPPFEMLALVLETLGGRKRFVERLGEEAHDPLNELLSQALLYERTHPPSLQGFLHWLETSETIVKRDMEQSNNEIRILTVHGAKGLEAPVVFMPDTVKQQKSDNKPILWSETDDWCIWSASAKDACEVSKTLKNELKVKRDEEYRRLMYVAMTRAQDELYVAAAFKGKNMPSGSWYEWISNAIKPIATEVEQTAGKEQWKAWRISSQQDQPAQPKQVAPAVTKPAEVEVPSFLMQPPKPEAFPTKPLTPSAMTGRESSPLPPVEAAERIKRGVIIHTLLEYLPALAPDMRAEKIRSFLSYQNLEQGVADSIGREVIHFINNPLVEKFLSPAGLSEVPVSGITTDLSGAPVVINGQIDRLLVEVNDVWIIDYKTGRDIPRSPTHIPQGYILQMQAYYRLLGQIYPGKTIHCLLCWTSGPEIIEIPADLLIGVPYAAAS